MSTNLKSAKSKTEQDVQMTSFNGGRERGCMLQFNQHDKGGAWHFPATIQADKKQVKKMVKVMSKWLKEQS